MVLLGLFWPTLRSIFSLATDSPSSLPYTLTFFFQFDAAGVGGWIGVLLLLGWFTILELPISYGELPGLYTCEKFDGFSHIVFA